jgi:hypothetical protein
MDVRRSLGLAGSALILSLVVPLSLHAQPEAPARSVPDFSSGQKMWVLMNGTAYFRVPGDTGPGPIVDMPGHEYVADYNNRVADTSNPILKPWAKKLMDINNARVLAGSIPFYPTSRCWPGGVPGLLLYPGEPVVFAQTAKEVWILYQRDAQVRRIYLDVPHSRNPGHSVYGESVGHYENGDTLVVDTIGLDDSVPLDRFRTPHTKQLHVVERYRLAGGSKNIEISFTVEDPGTFTMPWKGKVDFERGYGGALADLGSNRFAPMVRAIISRTTSPGRFPFRRLTRRISDSSP